MEEIKKIEVQGQQYGVADMLMRSVMGGNAQVIEWSHTHNMNDYKEAGTYRIKGERTGNPLSDNLPIMNQGSGHTIEGILYVLDSSLTNGSGNADDCTVTQFLMLSNRVGGQEGDMYMRSAYGVNKDSLTWKPWEKYQTNMEVGVVSESYLVNPSNPKQVISYGGMANLIDNGIYSGVYIGPKAMISTQTTEYIDFQDPTGIETFVMVVINNYAAAGDARCITQIKFAVTNGGVFSMEKRIYTTYWSQWKSVGGGEVDQQLDGYSTNAVANKAVYAQFYEHQEEINKRATKDNLTQGLDWEANTNKEFHIKNRTHHMKDYLCKYFTGSPIAISKPSDKGYVVIAYDTDGDAKYLKVEIKANEYKTQEFLDAMGLPIIFTWDNGASTINVQSFSGALDKLCMRAYYSSSAKSFDDYFVKLDEGFLPNGGGTGLPEGVSFDTKNGDKYYFGASDFNSLSIGSGVAVGREVRIGSGVNIGEDAEIGRNVKIEDNIHITEDSLGGMTNVEWTSESDMNDFKTPGTYNIYGERTRQNDNLPILNASSGHSIAARLIVVASTLQPANDEICITQFLMLSNRKGGDGNMYVRTYNENNSPAPDWWTPWQKLQGVKEGYIFTDTIQVNPDGGVQQIDGVTGLNNMIDNGIYSGIYTNDPTFQSPTFIDTFTLIVINNYAVAGKDERLTRTISQLKYAVDAITNQATVKMRTKTDGGNWSEWESVGGSSLGEWITEVDPYDTFLIRSKQFDSYNIRIEKGVIIQRDIRLYNGTAGDYVSIGNNNIPYKTSTKFFGQDNQIGCTDTSPEGFAERIGGVKIGCNVVIPDNLKFSIADNILTITDGTNTWKLTAES